MIVKDAAAKISYFAYGSNMCTGRLRRRVSSANSMRIARLDGHSFHFHKRSTDGSGKGNALQTARNEDFVWGVIFEIDGKQKPALDDAEGLGNGYRETAVTVTDQAGNRHEVFMYVAERASIDDGLQPYSWYKRFVVDGARQHQLPADYVAQLEAFQAAEDADAGRDVRNRAIRC